MLGERAISISQSKSMSWNAFQFEVKQCWKILQKEEVALLNACHLFAGESVIWPDQCQRVISFLHEIDEPVQQFCQLLENLPSLPVSVVPHRYLLLMSLQRMKKHIKVLILLITQLRALRQGSPRQVDKQRQDILHKLELLARDYSKTLEGVPMLFDQARFQEKNTPQLIVYQSASDFAQEAHFYENEGRLHSELGEKERAREYFEQALKLVKKARNRQGEGRILNHLGRTCSALGRKEDAHWYLESALAIVREVGDRGEEGMVLNNLGLVCNDLGHQKEAQRYLEQALSITREIGDRLGEGRVLNTLGLVSNDLGQREQALVYYEQALGIRREVYDQRGEGATLNNFGCTYDNLGQKEQAQDYYKLALKIQREVGDRWGEGKTLDNLGRLYADLGEYEEALACCVL